MNEKIQVQAKARVQITVEIEVSAWGSDCSIGQLYKQAADDGVNKLRELISESQHRAVIIGEPKVIGVITEKL